MSSLSFPSSPPMTLLITLLAISSALMQSADPYPAEGLDLDLVKGVSSPPPADHSTARETLLGNKHALDYLCCCKRPSKGVAPWFPSSSPVVEGDGSSRLLTANDPFRKLIYILEPRSSLVLTCYCFTGCHGVLCEQLLILQTNVCVSYRKVRQ